jgi:hypothetical protein
VGGAPDDAPHEDRDPDRVTTRLLRGIVVAILASACGTQAESSHAAPGAAQGVAPGRFREITAGLPDPIRVVYVSPSGGGNGKTAAAPRTLQSAVDGSKPGDEIRLLGGDYEGRIRVSSGGNAEHPIVIRNEPGQAARLKGWVHVDDGVPSVWIVGLDISPVAPPGEKGDVCVQMQGADVRVINNYIHDCGRNGISAWQPNRSAGAGQLVYGNVIARSDHAIYTQNRFEEDGYKKFIRNMFLDTQKGCRNPKNCFSFHGYTQGGWNSGLWVEESIVRGARFLIGGTNSRTRHTVLKGNVFYSGVPQIAYTSPSQHDDVSGNVVYKSPLTVGFWATDGPSHLTNNEFMNAPPGAEIDDLSPVVADEGSVAASADGGKSGEQRKRKWVPARFHPQDVIDGNTYLALDGGSIRSSWRFPDGRHSGPKDGKTLAHLRADLQAAGCSNCEAHAKTIPAPVSPRVFLWGNAYEKGRGELAIYRSADGGGSEAPVPVDLSPVVEAAAGYVIVKAADGPASTPVASGTYGGGTVNVPMTGEFEAFLVLPGGTGMAATTPTP